MTVVLWQGHEMDAYASVAGAGQEVSSPDTTLGRASISLGSNNITQVNSMPAWPARDEIWHRFTITSSTSGTASGRILWAARNAAGVRVARIVATATSNIFQAQIWNGTAYVNVGATFTVSLGAVTFWHVRFRGGNGGIFQVYAGQVGVADLLVDQTGDWPEAAGLVGIFHSALNSITNGNSTVRNSLVQTTSTLLSRTQSRQPTSLGTDATDGVGTLADVNEQAFNDATFQALSATGQRRSYRAAARTGTSSVVTGVTISCRAAYEEGGPTQIRPYLLISGVRYYGPNIALTLVFSAYQHTWALNPATGAAWTTAQADDANLEFGWEAV